MIIFLIVITVLVIILIAAVVGTYHLAFRPNRSEVDEYRVIPDNPQSQEYRKETWALSEEFAAIPYETVTITSFDGYKLYGRYYEVEKGASIEIQCHGYHGSPIRDFCGGNKIAREAGMNTLVIEERAMHRSEGRAITFGINEREDVKSWTEYCFRRFGNVPVILCGISMGAATVLMASELELPHTVKGVIADCPYSSPIEIIAIVGSGMKIPTCFLKPLIRTAAKRIGKFDIEAASPLEAVRNTKLPILIIHGTGDDFVPCDMSRELAKANPSIRLELFPGADHGMSYMVDRERYVRVVTEFTSSVLADGR